MTLEAQFLFPSCRRAGLDVRAVLRNTPRLGSGLDAMQEASPVRVGVSAFRGGVQVSNEPSFGTLDLGGEIILDASTVPALADEADEECLVVAHCQLDGGEGYFPQEHQLTYSGRGRRTHLVYDQLPVAKPGKPAAPIILLAPKVWVGREVNTYVAFSSAGIGDTQALEITILDEAGQVLHAETCTTPVSGVLMYDVRARLAHAGPIPDAPTFLTLVARGGASSFAILTFIVNDTTGACALEHSLSPHYYTQSGRDRLRREAAVFGKAGA